MIAALIAAITAVTAIPRPTPPHRAALLAMVGITAGALAVLAAAPVHAQSAYPNRPIALIVPYGAGGVADVGMRILGERLGNQLGQQIIIENRPGAGGIVAIKAGMSAVPDGYTLSMTGNNNGIAAVLFKSLPYNILTDFASVSTVSFFDLLIVTRSGSPLHSIRDVIKAAKEAPGNLNIGTINPGSTQHLAAELFKSTAGITVTVIPFRTSPDMATAILRGDIDIAFEFFAAIHGAIDDSKIVALASTGPKRTAYLPQVPTVAESGLPDYEVVSWNGISVPAGTPKAAVETLGDAIRAALSDPEVQKRSIELGMEMRASTPGEMTARIKADIAKWGAVIDKAGIPTHE